MSKQQDKFFDFNKFWFKCFGLWVPDEKEKSYKLLIYTYNAIIVSYSVILFTIAQIISILDINNDRATFIKNINLVSSFCVTNYKVYIWFSRRKEFLRLFEFVEDSFSIFEEHDDFKPSDIIAKRQRFKDNFLKGYLGLSYFISFFCLLNEVTQVLLSGEKYFVYSNETVRFDCDVEIPFQCWLPFDPFQSKIKHFFGVFMQVVAVILGGSITVCKK
ncbi:uncharacterized protein [Onthophagus taurus]|uniref:uncharacterized protein n=1 Tax=Onthophagus taurus TaxID=166361 RepID=UPI0039BDB712